MGTIYKQLLIGKKKNGDLGHVWMAAHFPNRIRRTLVEQTSIGSSVDKILTDQLPVVTYRVLGFLLLGLVRIYSKKVEHLLVDCNTSLNEMIFHLERRGKFNNVGGMCLPESSSKRAKSNLIHMPVSEFSTTKKRNTFVEAMCAQFSSISMPKNFELDAFELEIVEDESNDSHVKSHLEIVLHDAWESGQSGHFTFGKDRWDASTSFADHASPSAPITNISASNLEASVEKLRHRFSLDECMDPMVLSETDEVDLPLIPSIEQDPECMNTTASYDCMVSGDSKRPDREENRNDKHPEDGCATGELMVLEMPLVDNIMVKPSPGKRQFPITVDVTPQSKALVVSGEHKSDHVAVHTPALTEPSRARRKRKCVYDKTIVVPNNVYKVWVEDASDLVGKRRKAPTAHLARKKRRSSDYSLEPIIPIDADFPSDIRSFTSKEPVLPEAVEDTVEPNSKTDELGSSDRHNSEEIEAEAITPLSPVIPSTPVRYSETQETSKASQVEPTSSPESRENMHFPIADVELDATKMKEGPSSLGEENAENVHVAGKWSAVTKSVSSYLHDNLAHRKEKGEEEVVNLSQILKHRTKKESARFFAEILVLKTDGYIDVKQERAYDDIRVTETLKLKEVFRGTG